MVQRPIQQGDSSFQRDNGWIRNERPPYLDTSQETRFASGSSSVHPRCLVCPSAHTHENLNTDLLKTVEAALKECAGIPVKDFGLVVTLENGEERTFSSTSLAPYRQRFFTGEFYSHFRRAVRKASDDAYSTPGKTHTC
jgi:hypothetical protein